MKDKRRRAVYVAPIDVDRMEKGLNPSWAESMDSFAQNFLPEDGSGANTCDGGTGKPEEGNDERLLRDVPPHW